MWKQIASLSVIKTEQTALLEGNIYLNSNDAKFNRKA